MTTTTTKTTCVRLVRISWIHGVADADDDDVRCSDLVCRDYATLSIAREAVCHAVRLRPHARVTLEYLDGLDRYLVPLVPVDGAE